LEQPWALQVLPSAHAAKILLHWSGPEADQQADRPGAADQQANFQQNAPFVLDHAVLLQTAEFVLLLLCHLRLLQLLHP
jgi:hypothetical protein